MNILDLLIPNRQAQQTAVPDEAVLNHEQLAAIRKTSPDQAVVPAIQDNNKLLSVALGRDEANKEPYGNKLLNTIYDASNQVSPQPVAMQQQQEKSGWQKFRDSPFWDNLANVASGWAAGRTFDESLGLGGYYAQQGIQARKLEDQASNWLQSKGFSADDAKTIAANKPALNAILSNAYKANDPLKQLQAQKLGMEIEQMQHPSAKNDLMTVGKNLYNAKTGEWISNPSAQDEQQNEYGLNPQYGQDQNGNPVLLQIGKNGEAVQTKLPDGVTLSKAPLKVDAGTATVLIDPITRQPITTIAKDIVGQKSSEAQGKAQGEAIASAPASIERSKTLIDNIDALISNDGLEGVVGPIAQHIPPEILGGKKRDALARIDQIKGGVFLNAYNLLRGGGAITEVEGQKAEQAFARLNRAQDPKDFRAALMDLKSIIKTGMERQQSLLGGNKQASNADDVKKINTEEEYNSLPSGSKFIDPNGDRRTKP